MIALPRWAWSLIAAGALVGGVFIYGQYQRGQGKQEVQNEWDAAIKRGKAEVARLKLAAETITTIETVRYVDRVKIVREKADVIERVREVFVPTDSGFLTGGFRLYHDGAATNTIPDAASTADAAFVSVADVADTIARNYKKCHIAYETVEAFQRWANEQCKLNPEGCPPNG